MVEVPSAIVVRPLQHAMGREFSLLAFATGVRSQRPRGLARTRGSRRGHSCAASRGPPPRKTIGAWDAAETDSETTHASVFENVRGNADACDPLSDRGRALDQEIERQWV